MAMEINDCPTATAATATATATAPRDILSLLAETGFKAINFHEIGPKMSKHKPIVIFIEEKRMVDDHPLFLHPNWANVMDEYTSGSSENGTRRNFFVKEFSRDSGGPNPEMCAAATGKPETSNIEKDGPCLAASAGTVHKHPVNIPSFDEVCHGSNGDQRCLFKKLSASWIAISLKQLLTILPDKEVIKMIIHAGQKVDNQIGMGIIAVALADLATTESATSLSWFDKGKPVLYALLCAFQVSAVVLRPAKNITSSPALVKPNAEKLGDLMAGGTLFCATISLFCRCLAGIPSAYGASAISICTSLVVSCALFSFYSNTN